MHANSLKDLLQSRIDDLEKQVLSRVNSIEDGKLGLRNETEQRGRVESTLTSLHQRITDLEKGRLEEIIEGKIMKYTEGDCGCAGLERLQELSAITGDIERREGDN